MNRPLLPLGVALLVAAVVLFLHFMKVGDSYRAGQLLYSHNAGVIGFMFGVVAPIILAGTGISLLISRREKR